MKKLTNHKEFFGRLRALAALPAFWSLTVFGNSFILLGATVFYWVEKDVNPQIHSFLDPLWWAVATVTTVGYGEVSPHTTLGKWIGIIMMLTGTTLFCSFTALFASILIRPALSEVKENVKEIEKSMQVMGDEIRQDEELLDNHLLLMEKALVELKNLRTKQKETR